MNFKMRITGKELKKAKIPTTSSFQLIKYLIKKFNCELSGRSHIPLSTYRPSRTVWRRSTGGSYKEFGSVYFLDWMSKKTRKKYTEQNAVGLFWDWLSLAGAKDFGLVDDAYVTYEAKKFHKLLLLKHENSLGSVYIGWGSVNRLNNTWIYQHTKPK